MRITFYRAEYIGPERGEARSAAYPSSTISPGSHTVDRWRGQGQAGGRGQASIHWGQGHGVLFEEAKAKAILFSRNRKHWKDRTQGGVGIGFRLIPFNREATRWLGVYLDSRLQFSHMQNEAPSEQ